MQTCIYFNLTFVVEMVGVEPASESSSAQLSTSVSGLLGFPSAPAVRQADAYGSLQVMTGEEAIPCSRSLLIDAQI